GDLCQGQDREPPRTLRYTKEIPGGLTFGLSLHVVPYLEVETDHPVPVTQGDDRDIAGYVVLRLDNLLVGNFDVGAVGQGDIARHLLLDSDLRTANHG